MKSLIVGLAAMALSWAGAARAATIAFDDLSPQGGSVGQQYTFDGFEVRATGPNYSPNAQFNVYPEGHPNWTGTPGLTLMAVSGLIELRRTDGQLFNLVSIDLSRGDSNPWLVGVGFTGYREDGSTAIAIYRFSDNVLGRNETFSFGPAFQDLTSVVWYQGALWHQFDNIRVSSVVPEPGTMALAIAGLALLGVASGRRRA